MVLHMAVNQFDWMDRMTGGLRLNWYGQRYALLAAAIPTSESTSELADPGILSAARSFLSHVVNVAIDAVSLTKAGS